MAARQGERRFRRPHRQISFALGLKCHFRLHSIVLAGLLGVRHPTVAETLNSKAAPRPSESHLYANFAVTSGLLFSPKFYLYFINSPLDCKDTRRFPAHTGIVNEKRETRKENRNRNERPLICCRMSDVVSLVVVVVVCVVAGRLHSLTLLVIVISGGVGRHRRGRVSN